MTDFHYEYIIVDEDGDEVEWDNLDMEPVDEAGTDHLETHVDYEMDILLEQWTERLSSAAESEPCVPQELIGHVYFIRMEKGTDLSADVISMTDAILKHAVAAREIYIRVILEVDNEWRSMYLEDSPVFRMAKESR